MKDEVDIQFTVQEDEDSIQIIVSIEVTDEQIPSILEGIRTKYDYIQKKLQVQFTKRKFAYSSTNKVLNWTKVIEQSVFILDARKTYSLDVFSKNYLKHAFSANSITSLTDEEIAHINRGENDWYPSRFHPLRYQTYAKNSIVLRHKDEVIGWCITVPATPQLLLYDNLFVKTEYQSLARALSLFYLSLSIQIHQSSIRYFTFTVHGDNHPMLKVLRKRVADVLIDYQSVVVYEYCPTIHPIIQTSC